MKKHCRDALALISEVDGLIGRTVGISEEELKETFIAAVRSTAKAEAL